MADDEDDDSTPYVDLILQLFDPLLSATENPANAVRLLIELGYVPPGEVDAFETLGPAIGQVQDVAGELADAIEAEDEDAIESALLDLLVAAGSLLRGVNAFANAIQSNFAGSDLLTDTDIIASIVLKLVDYLLVRFLENNFGKLYAALLTIGLIELEEVQTAATPSHARYVKRSVNWDAIPDFFNDPLTALKDHLVGADGLRYRELIYFLYKLGIGLDRYPSFVRPDAAALSTFNAGHDLTAWNPPDPSGPTADLEPATLFSDIPPLSALQFPLLSDPSAGLALIVYPTVNPTDGKYTGLGVGVRFGGELDIPLSEHFHLVLKFSANLNDSLGFGLDQDGNFRFINKIFTSNPEQLADAIQFGVSVGVVGTGAENDEKLFVFGSAKGSRFEIGSGSLTLGLEKLDAIRLFVETDLKDGQIVLKSDGADGFLSKLLPEDGIQANFSLGIGVSNRGGLYFKGSSGLTIRLPLHLELGPISIDNLTIGFGFEAGRFPLTLATGISAMLGPLAAVVEDVGVRAIFEIKSDRSGNLGPLDLSFGFKPPKGVGLSIDAGVVKGGGYLFLDPDQGEYAGALELTISDFLSLKAIGLITTRMPDGSEGFSLLVIITAEFSPGLQLGYGFTLIGVGGLLGLNRSVVLDALALGVRTGAVDGIMFPVDPVANAPRIISDLRTIFPPHRDRFLIGPMAKIGWGSPTLISLALGVIIEIPGNIAILGVLKAILPDEEAALLKLQVNFVGAIEFDKKRGWFFAALFESRIVFITLEGEMGMLIAVGADANFVLSVGGFHPQFTPPPLPFPTPKRIAFDIVNTSVARIRADGYFAVTTNSVQTGAHAELFFGFSSFSVEGHMAFDALLRFSPFYLIVEISAGASLKAFGVGVFSIDLAFTLEGPTPWRAHGRGSISLWFISVSANFDVTWGDIVDTALGPIAILGLLLGEFEKAANWRTLPPTTSNLLVTLRKLELAADELVLHPLGTLEVSQSAIPLGFTLDKVGAQRPQDANRFSLAAKPGSLVRRDDARRGFAPAQFRDMNDAQKLSAPAYQQELSGLTLGVDNGERRCGRAVKRSLRYELTTIDSLFRRFVSRFQTLAAGLFSHFIRGAAVSKSVHSRARKSTLQPFNDRIEVVGDRYAVVWKDNNRKLDAASAGFVSENAAQEWLRNAVSDDPSLHGNLHVVPRTELSEAV